jgi:GTP-binding protein
MSTDHSQMRNIAIIAHVDHGKTTLLDQMFRQSGLFRDNQQVAERLMDNMDLEKERGITISAKNCSVIYNDIKINILDTPGHADFGSEVERALMMVDGAILLVDASEGPLPQTRFVLQKALERGLRLIVAVNKIDRQDARIDDVLNEIYDLFIDLDADENQIEFPVLYAIGRDGIAKKELDDEATDLRPLFDTIIEEVPPPACDPGQPLQILITDLSYSDYLGGLAIGRVSNGVIRRNQELVCLQEGDKTMNMRASKLQVYDGVGLKEVDQAVAGDIVIIAGIKDVHIGDTICAKENPLPLPRITIDEPTVAMTFSTNDGPFSGKEGKLVQSNKIRERLEKEAMSNVGLIFSQGQDMESFLVQGRGELQLAILIETMRREGFELLVGRPQVIFREEDGVRLEPIEHLFVDCDEDHVGIISEKLSKRKGRMINMVNHGSGRVRIEFNIPSRGLIGYRSEFLTDTKGTGLMNGYLEGYEPYRGDFPTRLTGSLVSDRQGEAVAYALFNLEPRGTLIVEPGQPVYEGLIVGIHNRENDLDVNPCKTKKLTNMRASGRDDNVQLTPVPPLALEAAIELIRDDELVEVTPKSIRLRKQYLSATERQMAAKRKKQANS